MLKPLVISLALVVSTLPALAAVDRATAISTLAGLYNSADVCNLSISRAKVDAYRAANAPKDDALFNVDVFKATHDLYDKQKDWTKDQTTAYCKTAADTVKSLGMNL